MSDIKLPGIQNIPLDSENRDILEAIKMTLETREGLRGDVEDRGVTVQDLIDLGLISVGDMDKVLRNR